MAQQTTFGDELGKLSQYLRSDSNEDARRPLLYPLFQKIFREKFKIESDARGADVYIEGSLVVEAKTQYSQWLTGFYQALHYRRFSGLGYHTIIVIAHKFVGIWKVNKLPEAVIVNVQTASAQTAPSAIGPLNARRTSAALKNEIRDSAIYWLEPRDLEGDMFAGAKNLTTEGYEILKILRNLGSDRQLINTHNFINTIERMRPFFGSPIEAVHAFYTMVAYWDITSTLAQNDNTDTVRVVGFQGSRVSDEIALASRHYDRFKQFVQTQYVFLNEGSGLTADYYFSRFDEVMAQIDPEYVRQHGIFFTNANLSRFALWFAEKHFPADINNDYIVFDPAGGSGNLVSSWRGRLRHKIVSELQPDLLRTIERRMRIDPFHVETGFTVVPRTTEHRGLNFLDVPAVQYLAELQRELTLKNLRLDKPLAFLLNPPYKNTDENQQARENAEAHYGIDPQILALTGPDAGNERYLAFLAQIMLMAQHQTQTMLAPDAPRPVVMIFTPTSWLIPRPTYVGFRQHWDQHFRYHSGFIITSNEFFKLAGRWPLAFTIWEYNPIREIETTRINRVEVFDLTQLEAKDLAVNFNAPSDELDEILQTLMANKSVVKLDNSRGNIRLELPFLNRNGQMVRQPRVNLYRNLSRGEQGKATVSGFPLRDTRHQRISQPHGFIDGSFVGFMDDNTPVRVRQEPSQRFSNQPDRVWFRLDADIKGMNKTQILSGSPDNRGYCAYDLASSEVTMSWFTITKVLNGRYPLWANQYDIWTPNLSVGRAGAWYAGCMAFVLAENRCIVTRFEADNPILGVPEIFVDNPLCPTNRDAFWTTTLDSYVKANGSTVTLTLVEAIRELYRHWNLTHCRGGWLYDVGLVEEPYFRYFSYGDFLTPYSGLVQIRKYTELANLTDMALHFEKVQALTRQLREELYEMLIGEFEYFK